MLSMLSALFSILALPFSWLAPVAQSSPTTLAPAPTDQELNVTRWEESYAPIPDPQGPTAPPAPAGQPTPQIPVAPLPDPDLTLGRSPAAPDQVTP